MNTKQLTYFLTLSKTKSIASSAKLLDIAQPSISQQIKNLEHEMGVVLFERSFRGVQLTGAGERFVLHAEAIIAQYTKAKHELLNTQHQLSGKYRIGMLESVGNVMSVELVEALQEYSDTSLLLNTVPSFEMESLLKQRKLDIAIGYENDQPHPSLVSFPLIDESMFLVIRNQATTSAQENAEHPLSIPFWKLSQYELLTPDKDTSFGQILAYYEYKTGVALQRSGAYSGQLMTGLRQVMQSDMGMILPSSAIFHLEPLKQLVAFKIIQPDMSRRVVAFVHSEQKDTIAMNKLIGLIKNIVMYQNKKKYWKGTLLF